MFSTDRPYAFHIEMTDKCNAGCPMCPRTLPLERCTPNPKVVAKTELTLADIAEHFSTAFCARVDEVLLGGAYGDPLLASEVFEVAEHLTARDVRLAVSTNGGVRRPDWWHAFGRLVGRSGGRVEFHIDGLADTHHLYRVRTEFAQVIENARALIASGARAERHFILFRHNQHQVEEAHALARRLGFARFVLIETVRFPPSGRFAYQTPDGAWRHLEAPDAEARARIAGPASRVDERDDRRPETGAARTVVRCKSAARNQAYISARGRVSACCWIAGSAEEHRLLAEHALPSARYDIRHRALAEIMTDEPFASLYAAAWRAGRLETCKAKCATMRRNRRHVLAD